jgi:hypothetical protein
MSHFIQLANTNITTTVKGLRLKVNEIIDVVNEVGKNEHTYIQVANANAKFATKAYAASNTAVRTLISDRIQVANVAAKYATKAYAASNTYVKLLLANTNAYIASVAANAGTGGGGGGYSAEALDYGLITSSVDVELNRDYGTL